MFSLKIYNYFENISQVFWLKIIGETRSKLFPYENGGKLIDEQRP